MPEFEMGPCGCMDKGMDLCLFAGFLPCLAYKEAAENIGLDGTTYCLMPFCGLSCCALADIGNKVAEAQGIDHGMAKSAICAMADGYTCYSCAVLNESRNYKEKKSGAPKSQKVDRN